MKEIVTGTVSVHRWTGMAYLTPNSGYYAISLGPKFSEHVSHGERVVAVVHERDDGRVWTDAVFNVDVTHPMEGAIEHAEQYVARHPR